MHGNAACSETARSAATDERRQRTRRLQRVQQTLDRLRLRFSELPMGEQDSLFMTLSAGVALWMPDEALEHWVERADQAMYTAKAKGRAQLVLG